MINGQGYPRRHFERGVHAASRLVHVCDVYDALRTRRPYRDAWESERVLKHIEAAIGTDFDTEAATAFCTMMRQWERRVATVDETAKATPASTPAVAP
jgi:putative two-component system response regulator